jgi:hypothetical protein
LPNKIHLRESNYFITQSIYRGWALLGIVLIAAAAANFALAVLIREQRHPFVFTLVSLVCLLATLVIFLHSHTRPIRRLITGPRSLPTGSSCAGNGKSHTPQCGNHFCRVVFVDDLDAADARLDRPLAPIVRLAAFVAHRKMMDAQSGNSSLPLLNLQD